MGTPNKWRRNRLTFRFLKCVTCGGGKRRHVLASKTDAGAIWACSRDHCHFRRWTPEEKRYRDMIAILKHNYRTVFQDMMRLDGLFMRSK